MPNTPPGDRPAADSAADPVRAVDPLPRKSSKRKSLTGNPASPAYRRSEAHERTFPAFLEHTGADGGDRGVEELFNKLNDLQWKEEWADLVVVEQPGAAPGAVARDSAARATAGAPSATKREDSKVGYGGLCWVARELEIIPHFQK